MLTTSLKSRLTLFTLAIFLISLWSLAFYAGRMLRDDMQRQLGDHQLSTVSFIAAAIDEHLAERVRALEAVARGITPAVLRDTPAVQSLLESQPVVQGMFSGGIFVTRDDGTAIAEAPLATGRRGLNFRDRDALAAALDEGRSTIGRPVLGRKPVEPVVGIAVPIRDDKGAVIGALAGVIALRNQVFVDHLTQNRFGRTGGYFLVARKERLIIAATDPGRVMQPLPARGMVEAVDRFVDGFEGSIVYTNQFGVEVLNSVKALAVADWGIASAIPTAEAFAPIRDMQRRMLVATILLTVAAGLLTWWMLKRQLAPMLATAKTLAHLSAGEHAPRPLPIARQDEIGELIAGFNRLLETLAQREAALKANEQQLFTILESVDAYIYLKDLGGRYVFANRSVRELFGLPIGEIVGQGDEKFFDADTAARLHASDRLVLEEGQTIRSEETNLQVRNGLQATYLSVKLPLRDEQGRIHALCGIFTDITDRKRMEDHIRELAFYDPLTRLPNRRLLQDRLRQILALKKRTGRHGALLFLDLDNFKMVNDTHGHDAGDALLVEAAERLLRSVRETDIVARYGGDEFVVILRELDADAGVSRRQVMQIGEKILERVSRPYRLSVRQEGREDRIVEHQCGMSIGVALFIDDDRNFDIIMQAADAAMYRAKEAGRNAIRFSD